MIAYRSRSPKNDGIPKQLINYKPYYRNNTVVVVANYCGYLFAGNKTFNKTVILGNEIQNCCAMFAGCENFNQPITIPNGVTDCSFMFMDCLNFKPKNLIFPITVSTARFAFRGCNLGNTNIFILNKDTVTNMMLERNVYNTRRLNIFVPRDKSLETLTTSFSFSYPNWQTTTNCIYSTNLNIYCYNNLEV